jgi:hypothetical protein
MDNQILNIKLQYANEMISKYENGQSYHDYRQNTTLTDNDQYGYFSDRLNSMHPLQTEALQDNSILTGTGHPTHRKTSSLLP